MYFGGIRMLKVGLCWQGSPAFSGDRLRSIALRHYTALAGIPDVCFVSLQKEHGLEQLAAVAGSLPLIDLSGRLNDFQDTAAVMLNLDLVITSDTSVAHLAGALGVPVWMALKLAPDWRWLLDRTDSPWYPTMRLFRQTEFFDWPGVFERIASELQREADSYRTALNQVEESALKSS
jgi:hypothetical protein